MRFRIKNSIQIFIVGGRKFQIVRKTPLKARFDMFVVYCGLRSEAVDEWNDLVFGFCWMILQNRLGGWLKFES